MRGDRTLKSRAVEQIARTPGKTCAELAALLQVVRGANGYAVLSGVLNKAAAAGEVKRMKQPGVRQKSFAWRYYPA